MHGFACNNNCLQCSVGDNRFHYNERPSAEIVEEMKKNRSQYSHIEFTGGEPTMRRDLPELIALAQDLGYKQIGLSSNGRLFSYGRICKSLIAAGLNKVTFSLLGPDALIHDGLTRTPNSFRDTIQGINNARLSTGLKININTVVNKINLDHLKAIGELILSLDLRDWYLLDLIPDGMAKKYYSLLRARFQDIAREFASLEEMSDRFQWMGWFDFPMCVVTPSFLERENVTFVNAQKRREAATQLGYGAKRMSRQKDGLYKDVHRTQIDICQQCKFYKSCGGIWKDYLALFGGREIEELARRHKCLRPNN